MDIMDGLDVKQECPNGHAVHEDCLKEWLAHSMKCPLCNEPYSQNIINRAKGYLEAKEKEKQTILQSQETKETIAKMEKVAEKIVLLKFVEEIEDLIAKKEYEVALDRIQSKFNGEIKDYKGQMLLFLQGKIHFLKEKYDLAINALFKLVKENFDYPEAFVYLGKSYQELGLEDKAKWAFDRVKK